MLRILDFSRVENPNATEEVENGGPAAISNKAPHNKGDYK